MAGENDLFYMDENQQRPHTTTLAKVVSSTFEKMGFMVAKLTEEEQPLSNSLVTSIDILNPVKATMFLSAPQNLAWSMAENLYGLEDLTLEVIGDMMSEILNTISGSLISEIMPQKNVSLSLPILCDEIPDAGEGTYIYHFNIDNNGIVTIVIKK